MSYIFTEELLYGKLQKNIYPYGMYLSSYQKRLII